MKKKLWLLGAAIVSLVSCQERKSDIVPQNLVCEYLTNPQAVDVQNPRLEWVDALADADARGVTRTAYQIEAASSREAMPALTLRAI